MKLPAWVRCSSRRRLSLRAAVVVSAVLAAWAIEYGSKLQVVGAGLTLGVALGLAWSDDEDEG